MGVEAGVPSRPSQPLVLPEDNMLSSFSVPPSFGQPKVEEVEFEFVVTNAHTEIVRLDVSVQETLGVYKLNDIEHLN